VGTRRETAYPEESLALLSSPHKGTEAEGAPEELEYVFLPSPAHPDK